MAYDAMILMAIYLLGDLPIERPDIALSLLNPVDLARIFLLLEFDISALMGFTGALFRDFFRSAGGRLAAIDALLEEMKGRLARLRAIAGERNAMESTIAAMAEAEAEFPDPLEKEAVIVDLRPEGSTPLTSDVRKSFE